MRTLWMAAFLATSVSAAPWEIAPPPAGHFAVDTTGTLRAETLEVFDQIANEIDRSGNGQLGLVVVRTTSGVEPRTFTTNLFNHWGIGDAEKNDGVLLMLALGDRKAELVVGSSDPLSTTVTDRIMRDDIVANMKRGDPDGAVLATARAVQQELATTTKAPAKPSVDEALARLVRREKPFPERTPRQWVIDLTDSLSASERAELELHSAEAYGEGKGRLVYLFVDSQGWWPTLDELVDVLGEQLGAGQPLAIVAIDRGQKTAKLRLPEDRVVSLWESQERYRVEYEMRDTGGSRGLLLGGPFAAQALRTGIPPRPMKDVIDGVVKTVLNEGAPFLVVGGVLLLALMAWLGRRWLRNRPRGCEHCTQPRERLSDAAEDAHLSPGQLTEEQLKSVDYDVWFCGRCDDVLVERYGTFFSRYGTCSSCGHKTASSSSRTISAATEYSTGLVRVTETCTHCSHVNTFDRITARITRTQTRSSSSFSSSSSSSFGGGRSSGSGSSGSW